MECKSSYDEEFETYIKAKCEKIVLVNLKKRSNATIQEPQGSVWIHLQHKNIHELEKMSSKLNANTHTP